MTTNDRYFPPPARLEPNFDALRAALTAHRTAAGMTMKDLAAESGVTAVAIGYLEGGKREGTLGTWFKLANALDLRLEELVTELYTPRPAD